MAKILIVDDSPTETYKLTGMLEKNGHSVITAGNGEEGVATAKVEFPDLVLMDIVMPGLNGFQATPNCRNDGDARIYASARRSALGRWAVQRSRPLVATV